MTHTAPLTFAPEVRDALDRGLPVVALESTIITHGMPWPQNLEMAEKVEATIREGGASPRPSPSWAARSTSPDACGPARPGADPAGGRDEAEPRRPGRLHRERPHRRHHGRGHHDLRAAGGHQGLCHRGIGGVHRGAEDSFDISADLQELAQTAVTVVAAGAKAILDLPKTWEVLETLGVPVIAYGQDELPAFWSRASGIRAPLRMDSPEVIAAAAAMRAALGLKGGQLVANPIPVEAEIPQDQIMPVIEQACPRRRPKASPPRP